MAGGTFVDARMSGGHDMLSQGGYGAVAFVAVSAAHALWNRLTAKDEAHSKALATQNADLLAASKQHGAEVEALKAHHATALDLVETNARAAAEAADAAHALELSRAEAEHARELFEVQRQHDAAVTAQRGEWARVLREERAAADTRLADVQARLSLAQEARVSDTMRLTEAVNDLGSATAVTERALAMLERAADRPGRRARALTPALPPPAGEADAGRRSSVPPAPAPQPPTPQGTFNPGPPLRTASNSAGDPP